MTRLALLIGLITLVAGQSAAQDTPVLRTEFEQSEAVPGQPLSLRLTLLVPTYMPKPPVWPSFESPNLLVRLPERASGPTSDRVGSDTWSGITRHYRLYPMAQGSFSIPAQPVQVTYADPYTQETVTTTLQTEPMQFTGKVPEAAEGLTPFLAANDVTLEQQLNGDPESLEPGDSVEWTVTARIQGTSPIFIPELIPQLSLEGFAAYPEEPVVSESSDRGVLGGTRQERITFVAEAGGAGELPALTLQWFDLKGQQIETASTEASAYAIDAPPLSVLSSWNWRQVVSLALAGFLAAGVLCGLARRLAAPWKRLRAQRVADYRVSEAYAFNSLSQAIRSRNLTALYVALDRWSDFFPEGELRNYGELQRLLLAIGRKRFSHHTSGKADDWRELERVVQRLRRKRPQRITATQGLPPMNPTGGSDFRPA